GLPHRQVPGGSGHPEPQAGPRDRCARQVRAGEELPRCRRRRGRPADGVDGRVQPRGSEPTMLRRNVSESDSWSYARIYDWLKPGELLEDAPEEWAEDWSTARADSFTIPRGHSR